MVGNGPAKKEDAKMNVATLGDLYEFEGFEWGGVTIDLARFPIEVAVNAIKRTVAHKLGNEVAADVVKEKEKAAKDGRELDEDEIEALTLAKRETMLERFYAGTIGLRTGGARGNALESVAFELAAKEAQAILAPKGAWPMPDKKAGVSAEDAVVELGGEFLNREQLTQIRFEKHKDRLMEEAAPILAERRAKAKANKEAKDAAKANAKPVSKDVAASELL